MAMLGSLRSRFFSQLALSLGLALLVLLVTQDFLIELSPLRRLELSTIDYRFALRGSLPIPQESLKVVILEISEESFKALPDKWPWPRSYYARVVRNLMRAGAVAVGIDLVFSEPDAYSPKNDQELRKAIQESGRVVIAGKTEIGSEQYVVQRPDENYSNIFFPIDSSIGIAYIRNDDDGVYRRYRPFTVDPASQRRIPIFSFAVLNKVYSKSPFYTAENQPSEFVYADRRIPKVDPVSMLINYYGPDRTFRHIKFADVMDDEEFTTVDEREIGEPINTFDDPNFGYLYDGTFVGKVVLVGSTMPEFKDLFPIPIAKGQQTGDNLMYGVEIHANVVQNVLDGNFLTREPQTLEVLSIVVFCVLAFFTTARIKEIKFRYQIFGDVLGSVVALVLLGVIFGASMKLFNDHGYLTALTSPSLAVIVGFVGATVYNYITERKQKILIKGMFGQYVNPTVVEELVAHPEKLRLGGERRELTVMFSDIEGFTTIAETMEPEQLVAILNEYLSAMTSIIFANEGTLDKYEGDAIMAFWGAPIPQTDHALRASRTAVEMQGVLRELREVWKQQGKPILNVRIGINTGEMIVGNMGGVGRFDYTIIGDTVNLGARLEGANKQYRTNIMINETTYEKVKNRVIARQLDLLQVKGKTEPTAVYELIGMADGDIPPEQLKFLDLYHKGLEQYRRREWQAAMESFQKALEIMPNDFPSYLYAERAGIYRKTPPPPDWNGVFILHTK